MTNVFCSENMFQDYANGPVMHKVLFIKGFFTIIWGGKILKRTHPGAVCSMEIVSVIMSTGYGIFSLESRWVDTLHTAY